MLLGLSVKNLALIEETEMEFTSGFNVLTGETGAGKSILIGSVNLALGAPADASLIRDGAEFALIEMTFRVDDPETQGLLREMDLFLEDDNTLTLQRKIMPGRSVCKVQGETVSVKQLRTLASYLINIHGQNDQQLLVQEEEQLRLLDRYIGEEAVRMKEKVHTAYDVYREARQKLSATDMDERQKEREADLIRFECQEIENAAIKENEDAELEEAFRKMDGNRKSADALNQALSVLDADEGILDLLSNAQRGLSGFKAQEEAGAFYARLSEIENLTQDVARDMRHFLDDSAFSEEDYARITERLNLLNRLKEKYAPPGGSVKDVLAYAEERMERLAQLQDLDAYRKQLQEETDAAYQKTLKHAKALSALRKKNALQMTDALKEALSDFDFNDLQFEIRITGDESTLNAEGMDHAVFMISTNTGEKMRRLSDVASGGELSRIMLGIRCVLADQNDAASMIFDEIDTGISGKTAWSVSKKLGQLSASRQVICITHLSQIAAMYDTHFLIYKDVSGNRTYTHIKRLADADSITELARLSGTNEVSDAALENARQIRQEAEAFKRKQKEKA